MSNIVKMADVAELKHMVMSFRVSELQVLLGFAGRNKSGRKQELQHRAVQLVQKGCSLPVQIKIRELYRQIFDPTKKRPPLSGRSSPPPAAAETVPSTGARLPACDGTLSNIDGPIDFSKHSSTTSSNNSAVPVHPDVQFKRLPFYDIMGELLKPTSLAARSSSRFQEHYFVFHLTPQQAQDIAMSRDFRPGAKVEYTCQIQLRFCLMETSCEQEDNFPPSICVRVNGKMAPLPNPIPTTKPGVEPKRPGRPVDITSLCRLSPTMPNHINISWASEFGRGYCVAVYLVKRLTSDILMQRLAKFGNRHADHSRALIKEKLAQDPDSEIATTSLRVSLLCPLGKMRMQVPCRASTCTHLQCFDATTFLMMNEKKPTWTCPVCDKPTPFNKLMIDGLFIEILGQAVDVNEITFTADGHWKPMKHVKETLVIPSPVIKEKATAAASISSPSEASPIKKPRMDVIDLTVSDDEDEDSVTTPRCVSPPVISLDSSPNGSLRSPSSYGGTPSHSITHSPPASPNSPARSNISSASSVSSSSSASSSTTLPYQNNSYSPISKPESPSPEPPPVSSISIPESRPASISSESNLLASALATNSSTSCFPPPSTSGGPSSLGVPPFPYNPIQNNYPFAIPPPPSLNPMPFDLDNLNDRDFDFLQSLLYDSR